MLCSSLGQPNSKVEEVTIRQTRTMQCCVEDATVGSKTASALVGVILLAAELIQRNGPICYPAVKTFSAISIHASTIARTSSN